MRTVTFKRNYTEHADGSVLVSFGRTRVLCTAMIEEKVPSHREAAQLGWLTAEYSMLPSSTQTRKKRAGAKPDGRSTEISRLIGRSLRASLDFEKLGPRTIWVDCDVLQADGGTRTASITGAFVAVYDAVKKLLKAKKITQNPIEDFVAAVSVGYVEGELCVDLDYQKDSNAEVDLNVVATAKGKLIEVQGTAEQGTFSRTQLDAMITGALSAIKDLTELQKKALKL